MLLTGMGTPGSEEGGKGQDAKNNVRNAWRKLTESEERLKFWKKMVGIGSKGSRALR